MGRKRRWGGREKGVRGGRGRGGGEEERRGLGRERRWGRRGDGVRGGRGRGEGKEEAEMGWGGIGEVRRK